ncbi:MAG TPA: hypothetical protein VNO84_05150 [Burkholderiaceae bacterium]|nr:hypothetical protein [Burkholderiaceae bacterium]
MLARLFTFAVWALAAGSAAFWALRLAASPLPVPAQAAPVTAQLGSQAAVLRMLGAPPAEGDAPAAPPPESARFKLLGVMAPREGAAGPGVALVSVDDKPPRAVALGAPVDGDLVLKELGHRRAAFGRADGPVSFTLELPELPPPRTGSLPPAGAPAGSPAPMPPSGAPSETPRFGAPPVPQ